MKIELSAAQIDVLVNNCFKFTPFGRLCVYCGIFAGAKQLYAEHSPNCTITHIINQEQLNEAHKESTKDG